MGEPRDPRPPLKNRLLKILALSVFSLVLVEVLLQLLCLISPAIDTMLSASLPSPMIDDPVMEHRPNPVLTQHDEWGYRNAERPDATDIVAIGDSQTYGASVRRSEAWPHVLGELTGRAVYNMGFGGWGAAHYLVVAREARALQPKRVIVGLYSGNDLADAYRMVVERGQLTELGAEPSNGTPTPDGDIAAAWKRTQELLGVATEVEDPRSWPSRNLKLIGLLRAFRRALSPEAAVVALSGRTVVPWQTLEPKVAAIDDAYAYALVAGDLRTVLTPMTRLAVLDATDPRIGQGEGIAQRALSAIHKEVHPGKLLVALIPTKEEVFHPLLPASHVGTLDDLHRHEGDFWRRTKAFLDAEGIPWVDTLPALRAIVARGENPYFADQDGHPNALGQHTIAEAIHHGLAKTAPTR